MSEDLIKEKFDNHEERISKLEDVTSTLQTMDYRLGTVEKTTSNIDDKLDKVLSEPAVEKSIYILLYTCYFVRLYCIKTRNEIGGML